MDIDKMDRDSQALVGNWLLQTGEISEGYQEAHLDSEILEFRHEFENGRDPELLKQELTDIAIAVLGLAVQYDFDLSQEIEKKMEVVNFKYNPEDIAYFMEMGYSRGEAMSACKRIWQQHQQQLQQPQYSLQPQHI